MNLQDIQFSVTRDIPKFERLIDVSINVYVNQDAKKKMDVRKEEEEERTDLQSLRYISAITRETDNLLYMQDQQDK